MLVYLRLAELFMDGLRSKDTPGGGERAGLFFVLNLR